MSDLLIIALGVIIGFPALIGLISFASWENGFRIVGMGYIVRMTIVLILLCWGVYLIPEGAA